MLHRIAVEHSASSGRCTEVHPGKDLRVIAALMHGTRLRRQELRQALAALLVRRSK